MVEPLHCARCEQLQRELDALRCTNRILMDRVEDRCWQSQTGVDHSVQSFLLEEMVRQRTKQLETVNSGLLAAARERQEISLLLTAAERLGRMGGWRLELPAGRFFWTREVFCLLDFDAPAPPTLDEICARLPEEIAVSLRDALHRCHTVGADVDLEMPYQRRDGEHRWIRVTAQRVEGEHEHCCVQGLFADISESKRTHAQLAQAQKLESIGQLAAGIAHEINTPAQYVGDNTRFLQDAFGSLVSAVRRHRAALAELTGEPPPDEEDLEYLCSEIPDAIEQSLEGLDRVATIVRAMKDFSHPGSDEKELTDLNAAIESTVTVCRNCWKYVAEVELRLDPDLPKTPVHAGEFNQVVLNLVVNAADAITESRKDESLGRIVVTTRRDGDDAVIEVRDDGPGIPESIRGRVFDPFFTTKEVGKGTGQGLAICHNTVVVRHGGQLAFHSTPGQGTTFIVRLPLQTSRTESSAASTPEERAA